MGLYIADTSWCERMNDNDNIDDKRKRRKRRKEKKRKKGRKEEEFSIEIDKPAFFMKRVRRSSFV